MRKGHRRPMNYLNPIIKDKVLKLLRQGYGNRETARQAHCNRVTVKNLRANYHRPLKCKCGRIATHRGFCSARFRRSFRRMQFMENFTKFSMREYIGLSIPLTRWETYGTPQRASRSVEKWIALHGDAVGWDAAFISKRESIIDDKIEKLRLAEESKQRKRLVRPSVARVFRTLSIGESIYVHGKV